MHVILGSGGAIARPLAEALASHTDRVRCVSRSPHVLPQGAPTTRYEHVAADLLDREATVRAVSGAEIVYLTVGLTYDSRVWRRAWPALIENVIAACAKTGARLAFFDNVYAYAASSYGHMTEAARLDPPSVKGEIRRDVVERLWRAHASGECAVTIARAADFYGPGIGNSMLGEVVFKRLAAGQTPQWLGAPDLPHSFTYTPDAGRHFALLANDERAWGESWHLPTAAAPWTPRQWAAHAAELCGLPAKLTALPRPVFWALSRVSRMMYELWDVRAQTNAPYVFDSGKFEAAFGVRATPYAEGLEAAMAAYRMTPAAEPLGHGAGAVLHHAV